MIEEIASRLLVIVRDKYWGSDSFIKLGPLRALEKRHGKDSLYVLDDEDIGMQGSSAAGVHLNVLQQRLKLPLQTRLKAIRDKKTFDPGWPGHVIKLIVGLIQDYGALTIEELSDLLSLLRVPTSSTQIAAYLLCAEAVEWVVKRRKGSTDYYFAKGFRDAASIGLKDGTEVKNKSRRRLLIREHWKAKDVLRSRGIREFFVGGPA